MLYIHNIRPVKLDDWLYLLEHVVFNGAIYNYNPICLN